MKRKTNPRKCECGGEMVRRHVTKTIPLAGRKVRVENIVASICESCGEIYFDGPTLLKLERKLLKQPITA